MVTWSGVVPAVKVCGGAGPDTFIVKVNNGTLPSVAIDAPANGNEFTTELERIKSTVLSDTAGGAPGEDLPPALLQEFQQYLATTTAFVSCTIASLLCKKPHVLSPY